MLRYRGPFLVVALFLAWSLCAARDVSGGQLFVGGATVSITPDERVALAGQMHTRISTNVETPCMATALAIETRDGEQSLEQVVFVSCDLVAIRPDDFGDQVRAKIKGQVPDFLLTKLVINATHTHTAPVTVEGTYEIPESGVMRPSVYYEFLTKQVADAIVQAWGKREASRVAWGLGHAVVAQNRRAVFGNGTAVMYGKTNDKNFRGLEGTEDHGVELLYFWNAENKLIATAINVACPAQEVGSRSALNADFWHPVRETLKKKHGEQLHVVAWIGAAGDQSPHIMYRKAAEERMRKLRGLNGLQEIARRIVSTWEDVYQLVQKDQHQDVVLEHRVENIELPYRKITALEAKFAKDNVERLTNAKEKNSFVTRNWHQRAVTRYEQQQAGENPSLKLELHAVRLGDVAIVTNPFELFTDYGTQIKSRSPALQTFVIQLCQNADGYLATERAVSGGGYSAVPQSGVIGPDGGQLLVTKTVDLLDLIWKGSE